MPQKSAPSHKASENMHEVCPLQQPNGVKLTYEATQLN